MDRSERVLYDRRDPAGPRVDASSARPCGHARGQCSVQQLYRHEQRLGLPHVPVHDLRHTPVTHASRGADLEDVKVTLGHASIRITSDTYSHQQPGQRERGAMQRALRSS